jgi:hypothetical protein
MKMETVYGTENEDSIAFILYPFQNLLCMTLKYNV